MRCMGCMEKYDSGDICPICGFKEGTKAEDVMYLNPGTELAERYELGRVLGSGGFGITYIAWDNILEKKVAIKEYLPSEFSTRIPGCTEITIYAGAKGIAFREGLLKFVVEARQLSDFVKVDGIVKIEDCFEENSTAYIVMEYLEGETLEDKLKREGKMDADKVVELMSPIMEALVVVHEKGIIHRDIAPDNIYITTENKAKLLDFGSARSADSFVNESRTVIVKKGYSPEEQYASRTIQTSATDVYAMAATMYRAITGEMPPDALERRMNIQTKKKDLLVNIIKNGKNVTQKINKAILSALELDQNKRTQNMAAFIKKVVCEKAFIKKNNQRENLDSKDKACKIDDNKDIQQITEINVENEKKDIVTYVNSLIHNKRFIILGSWILSIVIIFAVLIGVGVIKFSNQKDKKIHKVVSSEKPPKSEDTFEGEWLVNEITTEDGTILDVSSGEDVSGENSSDNNDSSQDSQDKTQTSGKSQPSGKSNTDSSGNVTSNGSGDTSVNNSGGTSSSSGGTSTSGQSDGTSLSTSSVFKYTVSSNAITITGYSGSATKIEIPSTIDGYKVTGIGGGAFNNNKTLTKLYIPATVTAINGSTSISSGKCPFYGCSMEIKIYCEASEQPNSWGTNWNCTSSGNSAPTFYGVSKNGDKYVQDISRAQFTYTKNEAERSLQIDYCIAGLEEWYINEYYMIDNNLYTVTQTRKFLGGEECVVKNSCDTLRRIVLPDTLITINSGFACGVNVSTYACKKLNGIIIPNSVTVIEDSAFLCCTGLKYIRLGEGLERIDYAAFSGCTMLENIFIPQKMVIFGDESHSGSPAFSGCTSLKAIYCEASCCQNGWSEPNWHLCSISPENSEKKYHTVKYGYTYAQYLAETGSEY